MRTRTASRVLFLIVMLDGIFSCLFGHAYMQFLRRVLPRQLGMLLRPFLQVPQPLFRLGAFMQALLAAYLLLRRG